MIYHFIWTELVDPPFDDETKMAYVEMANKFKPWAQCYPIGNVVNGRRMFHGLGPIGLCDAVLKFLTDRNCDPKLISIRDIDAIDYGYKKIQTGTDENGLPIFEIVRDELIKELKPINQDDPDIYMQPIEGVDEDGNPIMIQPPRHTFAGWSL